MLLTTHAENEVRNQKPFNMHALHKSTWLHQLSKSSSQHCPSNLALKCRLSTGKPTHCYMYEVQSVLYKSYTVLWMVHNNRPGTIMLDKTIEAAHSVDATIPNSDKLHNTITEKLQVYANLKHGLTNIWQLNAPLQYHSTLSNNLHDLKKKLLNLKFCLFIFSTAFI